MKTSSPTDRLRQLLAGLKFNKTEDRCFEVLREARRLLGNDEVSVEEYSEVLPHPGRTKEEIFRSFERWLHSHCKLLFLVPTPSTRGLPELPPEIYSKIFHEAHQLNLLDLFLQLFRYQRVGDNYVLPESRLPEEIFNPEAFNFLDRLAPRKDRVLFAYYFGQALASTVLPKVHFPLFFRGRYNPYLPPIIPAGNISYLRPLFTTRNSYRYLKVLSDVYNARYEGKQNMTIFGRQTLPMDNLKNITPEFRELIYDLFVVNDPPSWMKPHEHYGLDAKARLWSQEIHAVNPSFPFLNNIREGWAAYLATFKITALPR